MPVEWSRSPFRPAGSGGDGPLAVLRLCPHRSLSQGGFVAVIGLTFVAIMVPVLPLLGTPVLWGLLPFVLGAVAAVWAALRRSYRDGDLTEELTLWPDRVTLLRRDPDGRTRGWEANPHWVRVAMREAGGPVEGYVTLRGNGREVEIGAFLSVDERRALYDDLVRLMAA
jgi:uncharacterized membrane protein